MGILDTLRVGASGIFAASSGLDATSQNIATAFIPGQTRRSVVQSTRDAVRAGIVQIGQGVQVDGIVREGPGLLGTQRVGAAGDAAFSESLRNGLSLVGPLVDETVSSGPRSTLTEFFEALTRATTDPGDPNLRIAVLNAAEAFTTSVNQSQLGFDDAQRIFIERVEAGIGPINEQLAAVADYNQQIASIAEPGAAPDLGDERDRIVRALGELGGFTVRFEADETATVFLDGHIAVQGDAARQIAYESPGGFTLSTDTGEVPVEIGGEVGGTVAAYEAVSGYSADLNQMAQAFAERVNEVQALGFTRTGDPGPPVFTFDVGNPAATIAVSDAITRADLAWAGAATAAAGDGDNLARLVALQDESFVDGRTPGDALSRIVDDVGLDLASAERQYERSDTVLFDLDSLAQNLTGIDVDEEATQLIAFQTAYQASARVVSTAQSLVGTLLEIT